MKRAKKIISGTLTVILACIFILMLFITISSRASGGEPEIFGHQLKVVLSGSMEPGIKTGSIIAIEPGGDMTRFKEDDVITFKMDEDKLVTHRIVGVTEANGSVIYETKGDNNNAPDMDPVLPENVVGEYNGFTIPYVGYFLEFAQSKEGSALLLIVPGILMLIYAGFSIFRAIGELEIKKKDSTT
ncbi:signal peptidase I [Bacillus carboniphilus]|uniref:Signal peptidase I n=1 Tax=Bacillus carboniphilus TaxID=86663 RepID=A0ABY9JUG1_9BACI|nr:signal peptidase I [Bacillus carboniphilus]WLR42434.1 signal peptidase I [Bacillus carboniphilus]